MFLVSMLLEYPQSEVEGRYEIKNSYSLKADQDKVAKEDKGTSTTNIRSNVVIIKSMVDDVTGLTVMDYKVTSVNEPLQQYVQKNMDARGFFVSNERDRQK